MNTIIEKIRAEIKIRLSANGAFDEEGDSAWHYDQGLNDAYNYILSFLSDLEKSEKPTLQEQPVDTYEDERIRQGLISYLKADMEYNPSQSPSFYTEALAYLGQQSKQKVCEGLEEEIKTRWNILNRAGNDIPFDTFNGIACHFAQWGAEHRGSSEIPKDLESYAQKVEDYYDVGEERGYLCVHRGEVKDAVIAGAKWQAEQDLAEMAQSKSPLSVAYANRCFENGKQAMKEQMMKEAVEGKIYGDIKDQEDEPYEIWAESYSLPKDKFHLHENVKLVIINGD